MPLRDYSEDDDFYEQDFARDGFVSVWVGLQPVGDGSDVDVLQDLCGVGYYRLSDQESHASDGFPVPIQTLLQPLSHSETFLDMTVACARARGIESGRWLVVQYDFGYDASRVLRHIADDPVFLGAFGYRTG